MERRRDYLRREGETTFGEKESRRRRQTSVRQTGNRQKVSRQAGVRKADRQGGRRQTDRIYVHCRRRTDTFTVSKRATGRRTSMEIDRYLFELR